MKRQPLLGFIAINVIVTVLVAFGIIFAYTKLVPPPTPPVSPPLFVVISSTPDPNQTPRVVFVPVTTTPGGAAVVLASTAGAAVSPVAGTLVPLATDVGATDTTSTPTAQSVTDTPAGIPTSLSGCQQYAVKKGDIAGSIALNFGVSLADLYAANGLKPNPILQIGQLLVIPTNGCGLATSTPTPAPTDVASMTPTPQPTSTLAPTTVVTQASIAITAVIKPGDITAEGVKLHNNGTDIVDLTNWTISDGQGNLFTFPAYRIFPAGDVLVNTRAGAQNTPRQLFWGRSTPLWSVGATVTLTDSTGAVQTTFVVTGQ